MLRTSRLALARHGAEVGLAAAVVLMVGMMIVPLPTWLLDVLLATNLSLAVLLLLVAVFVRDALSFGAFPTLLLVTTLFRLALNVSSTRLILLQADAGEVIRSFGELVVRGDYVVGAVVFLILTIIQLVVIARGSERVAEVGARFTLDAMPGKQLAIDADLRAGTIDAEAAAERRRALERESQLYGAMDGAMKFVKGDAIASILITIINVLGGLAIGVLSRELSVAEALRVYGLLTIGDGLVSQIPALLISTAAGLVVTRVASEHASGTLGGDVGAQVFGDWRALGVTALFAALLALVPGLPFAPFAVLAALLGTLAWALFRRRPAPEVHAGEDGPALGPLELSAGARLARMLATDAVFADRLSALSLEVRERFGVRLPPVQPRGGAELASDAYVIALAAVPVDRGRCPEGHLFVHGTAETLRVLDPAVELDGDGGWVSSATAARASALGHRVRGPVDVVIDRLRDALLARPEVLLGVQETQRELDRLARDAPALVRAVVPERLPLPRLARLLRALLAEGVSVRPLREILEALALEPIPEREGALVEVVRARLSRQLTHGFAHDGVLAMLSLDPMLEEGVRDGLRTDGEPAFDPELARDLVLAVRRALERAGERPVLVTQPDLRAPLRGLLAPELPGLAVLSYRELDPTVQVRRLGVVTP